VSQTAAAAHDTTPAAQQRKPGLFVGAECVVGAVLTVTLAGYMLLGNYTRYVADDYGTAIAVRLRGFWAQQVAAYRLTDGHFVATALQTAMSLVNPVVVRVLPAVLVVLWVGALTLGLRHLVPNAGLLGRFVMAEATVYTVLRLVPSPFLTLYWMTASVAFVVPLIIAAVVVWLISRPSTPRKPAAIVLAVIGLLAFIASGEAEVYTVAAFVAWTLALAVAIAPFAPAWRAKLPQLGAAWIGATAALAVQLASPGNGLRSAAISKIIGVPRPTFITLPFFTLDQMYHFGRTLVLQHWKGMLALALLVALIAVWSGVAPKRYTRPGLIAAGFASVGTLIVVFAAMTPAALEYGSLPPLYDQLILVFACVCAIVALAWIGGRMLRNWLDPLRVRLQSREDIGRLTAAGATLVVAAIVVIGPIATVAMMHQDLPSFEAYAADKDAQAAAAETAHSEGRSSVIAPALVNVNDIGIFDHNPLEELTTDPTYWINEDTANYYGITTMAVPR
jgi:hypothetical protein